MTKIVEVVVGVLQRGDGAVLLNARPEGKPYAGWWEFPGGKVEPGEGPHEALAREMAEELGLELRSSRPWFVLEAHYPHAHVRLHFRRSVDFAGTPQGLEGQAWGWFAKDEATPGEVLPASVPVLRRVWMPEVMPSNDARWRGVRADTADALAQAAAQEADYAVVEPDRWDAVTGGEPPLPAYVALTSADEAALAMWRERGASGIFAERA